MARLATTIEAILYLKAQPLTLAEIAETALCDRDAAEEGLLELMADYAHRDTALEVVQTPDGYSLQLRETFQTLVQSMIPADIGKGALRTLAVIALKGPIVQSELINLRGSTAYQHVQDLVEQGFARKRRRADGRSPWLQVTDKFHQYFQLDQLPGNLDQLLGSSSTQSKGKGAIAEIDEAGALGEAELLEPEVFDEALMVDEPPIAPPPILVPDDHPDAQLAPSPESTILSDELLEIEEAQLPQGA
ncbi:MAG: SMC-Scp complex subunit ScpB [Alkalinema sp. RU_4_3]|nr:SMC-Scp complex subunit ScpB [Alkalinema sp. RU_4_3]